MNLHECAHGDGIEGGKKDNCIMDSLYSVQFAQIFTSSHTSIDDLQILLQILH